MEDEMTDTIEIQRFTWDTLYYEDIEGLLIGGIAFIAYYAFREPPWSDKFEMPRLHYGLGVDLMRRNAIAYLARTESGVVGYILGYEVFRAGEDPRDLTLQGISGAEDLDYLFEDGRRVFYGDTLCVAREFRRWNIGEKLTISLIGAVRELGFDYYIGRTHIQADTARGRLLRKRGFEDLPIQDVVYPDRTYWLLRLGGSEEETGDA